MKRVLVVYKKSFLESHSSDKSLLRRIPAAERNRYRRADAANRHTVEEVAGFLERQRVKVNVVYRGSLAANPRYDLVVTVGGDGTFFAASHYVRSTPIFAVNSDPENSLGLFTAADRSNFREPLALALSGRLHETRLNRLTVFINRKKARELAVNDVLFAHRNPASMSRYRLWIDGRDEIQRSSGLWIATAAGSTAGIRAAGGARQPIESTEIQYRTREPYGWPADRRRHWRGLARRALEMEVLSTEAAAWIDGSRVRYDLKLGDRLRVVSGAAPVILLGYDDERRRRVFP
jgi:NAD+ kinase